MLDTRSLSSDQPRRAPADPAARSAYVAELKRRYRAGTLDLRFEDFEIPDALLRLVYPELFRSR